MSTVSNGPTSGQPTDPSAPFIHVHPAIIEEMDDALRRVGDILNPPAFSQLASAGTGNVLELKEPVERLITPGPAACLPQAAPALSIERAGSLIEARG